MHGTRAGIESLLLATRYDRAGAKLFMASSVSQLIVTQRTCAAPLVGMLADLRLQQHSQ